MICRDFIHVGICDTGEGIIRNALQNYVRAPNGDRNAEMIPFLKGHQQAHMPLSMMRQWSDAPAFTSVRNPFDWYISHYLHHLKNKKVEMSWSDWFPRHRGEFTKEWQHMTNVNGKEGVAYIFKFENMESGLAETLSILSPKKLTQAYVLSWFPDAYRQWCNRPWIEGIEQWLRYDLYTETQREAVESIDGWALERWDYSFYDVYDFPKASQDSTVPMDGREL